MGNKFVCAKHFKGAQVKVTIEFEQNVLDGTEAAKIALAVKRSIDGTSMFGKHRDGHGPIVDTDGTVLGQWKAEQTKRRAA